MYLDEANMWAFHAIVSEGEYRNSGIRIKVFFFFGQT